jgi:hypothetical protein
MRASASALLAALGVLVPARAFAHPSHDGGGTRDHRSSSSSGSSSGSGTRDHRSGSSSGSGSSGHVRDHRSGSSSSSSSGGTYDADGDCCYGGGYGYGGGGPSIWDDPSMPTMTWELGGLARTFRGPAFTRRGTVMSDGGSSPYTVTGGTPSPRDSAAGALDVRLTFPTSRHVYAGGELELGGLTRSPIHLMSDGGNGDLAISSTVMFGAAAVAGVRTRAGVFEIDAELAGGVRTFTTSIQPYDGGDNDNALETVPVGLLEGRLKGVLWLSPRWFVSAQTGAGVLDRSDVNVAILIGGSTHAFGQP